MSSRYGAIRQRTDRDATREALGAREDTLVVSGRKFRDVRVWCGYSARGFAEFLHEINAPITTTRSVYSLEIRDTVTACFVDAMKVFVGPANFAQALREIRRKAEERERWYEERAQVAAQARATATRS
jgi:hypothetical protein